MMTPRGAPPAAPRPWWARLTAPPGPAVSRLVTRGNAAVMCVPGRYSVTYLLLGPESVVAADVGSITDVELVLAALRWLGRPLEQVRYVTPTHLHMDHVMGLDALARTLAAPVALGRVAYENVTAGRELRWPPRWALVRALGTYFQQGAPRPPPLEVRRGLDFGFPWARNRFTARLAPPLEYGAPLPEMPGWTLLHTPGHADDAVCLYHEEARFLVSGDTVRNFLGGEWNPLLCDPEDYARTKRRLLELDVEAIFPGHGPVVEGSGLIGKLKKYPFFVP